MSNFNLYAYSLLCKRTLLFLIGVSLYNRMGLTTQVPRNIKIASRDKRITVSVRNIKGNPVKSYVDVTAKNYALLEILDALKDFKKIPDLDKNSGIKIISNQLKKLGTIEIKQLIDCALSYPPRVRAFLGALLEQINFSIDSELKTLIKSLNPLSEYNYGINKKTLPTITNWNIK